MVRATKCHRPLFNLKKGVLSYDNRIFAITHQKERSIALSQNHAIALFASPSYPKGDRLDDMRAIAFPKT